MSYELSDSDRQAAGDIRHFIERLGLDSTNPDELPQIGFEIETDDAKEKCEKISRKNCN